MSSNLAERAKYLLVEGSFRWRVLEPSPAGIHRGSAIDADETAKFAPRTVRRFAKGLVSACTAKTDGRRCLGASDALPSGRGDRRGHDFYGGDAPFSWRQLRPQVTLQEAYPSPPNSTGPVRRAPVSGSTPETQKP